MELTPAGAVAVPCIVFVLGTMVGSFLNVCTFRIPRRESIVMPGSRCMNCETPIPWYHNIPIISYLVLRGRCRNCMARFSSRYFFVELGVGILFLATYLRFGLTPALPVYMAVLSTLVVVTIIDMERYIIPGSITTAGIVAGLLTAMCASISGQDGGLLVTSLRESLIGMVAGGGLLWAVDQCAVHIMKKPGMGGGDVRLLAMLGTFLGWRQVIVIVFLASLSGAIVGIPVVMRRRRSESDQISHYIPFGPFLAIGGALAIFFGQDLLDAWQSWIIVTPRY
ncbi:MAG: prepilin peptidase [Candidatus Hydrogenedentes bacterium]|nr:prepilin peptidase [Candidatus Hydrogenedentota bacterium]